MSEPAPIKSSAKPASSRRPARASGRAKAVAAPTLSSSQAKPTRVSGLAKPAATANAVPRPVRAPAQARTPFARLDPDQRRLAQAQLAYLLSEELGYRAHDLAVGILEQTNGRDEPQFIRQARKIRRLLAKIKLVGLRVPTHKEDVATDTQRDRDWKRMRRHLWRKYLLRARLGLELDSLATWLDDNPTIALDAFDAMTRNWTDGLFAGAHMIAPVETISDEQLADQSREAMLQIPFRRVWQDMTAKPKGKKSKAARKA